MIYADLPAGATVFLDASVFIHHFEPNALCATYIMLSAFWDLMGRGIRLQDNRLLERTAHGFDGVFQAGLAALRLPERMLIFDTGDALPLAGAET